MNVNTKKHKTKPFFKLQPESFKSNNVLYAYTDDGGCNCNNVHLHSGPNLQGAITVRVKFTEPLPKALTLFCYAAYPKTLLVDKNLNTTLINTL